MNLKQLSDILGLSPTTVSRAINGYPEVSAKTRERVLEAASKHGYVPNSVARRLATGRAMAIGHIVPLYTPEMLNPIFADFIAGAGETYSSAGYNMILSVVREDQEDAAYRNLAAAQSVDGVIVHSPRANDPRIPMLNRLKLPFIVHGRTLTDWPYSWLDINNRSAFYQATRYLAELGHRRIALLNGPAQYHFAQRRETGYRQAMGEAGVSIETDLIRNREMSEPFGHEAGGAMLDRADPPTAILTSSLIIAFGVRRAAHERGLLIGRDISIMTFDDALSFLPNNGDLPEFTAMRSSVRDAGRRLSRMLIDQIEGRTPPGATELWEAELILGRSTGPPAGG